MDDVESGEPKFEGLNPPNVRLVIKFKSGGTSEVDLKLPIVSPVYDVPLDYQTLVDLIVSSYAMGENPALALPLENGSYLFLDLEATDFMELVVLADDE